MPAWNSKFVEAVKQYSSILYDWTKTPATYDFLEAVMWNQFTGPVDWVSDAGNYELEIFQKCFVVETINRVGNFKLTEKQADETFAIYLARAAFLLWREKLQSSRLYSSSYLDGLIRRVITTPLSPGIGYLSLALASTVPMTETIINEIDISRKFTPKLPFTLEEIRSLNKVTRKETRLRFALVIANAFGRCCDKLKIELNESNFQEDFQKMIHHYIIPPNPEFIDLIREDIRLIVDVLIFSRKEPPEVPDPPPSPQKIDFWDDDELLEDIDD